MSSVLTRRCSVGLGRVLMSWFMALLLCRNISAGTSWVLKWVVACWPLLMPIPMIPTWFVQ